MPTTRRTFLAATGAGLASSEIAVSGRASADSDIANAVAELIRLSAESNTVLMRGDIDRYRALVTYTDGFTLMSPFGGTPTHGRDLTSERMEAMGRFFKNGTFTQKLVQAYGSADMVVLAIIEHCHVEVGGLPLQEWPLRVTLVYRRDGSVWRLAHRHADPLVAGVSHKTAAALAQGEIK